MTTPIVAVVTFDHFSPFHCAVPSLIFGDILPGQPLFELKICCGDGNPHSRSAQGFTIQAPHGLEVLAEAEIIVIPFWHDPAARPPAALLDALIAARTRGRALPRHLCTRLRRAAQWSQGIDPLGVRAGFLPPLSLRTTRYQRPLCR